MVTLKELFNNGLSNTYTDILDFVPKHCTLLMELTCENSPSNGSSHTGLSKGFDFLVNSVWPAIVFQIEKKVAVIFAPGDPNTFHKVSIYLPPTYPLPIHLPTHQATPLPTFLLPPTYQPTYSLPTPYLPTYVPPTYRHT